MQVASPHSRIPQPRRYPVVGNLPSLEPSAPVQSLMRLARELGPLFRLELPTRSLLVASSHDYVHELCDETRFAKYVFEPLQHLRDLAGDGLFTAYNDEPNWERAHRILMPAFGPAALRGYFDSMLDVAEQLCIKLERLGPKAVHDVPDVMTRLTLDTIALCGFDHRFNSYYSSQMHPFVDAMMRSLEEAGQRARRVPLLGKLMRKRQETYRADIALMNQVVDQVISERRAQPGGNKRDLLSLMLEGRDPLTGAALDDVNIRYQIVTFLIAGHETTSGLLSFAIHLLLENPAVLSAAIKEVDSVFGADSRHLPTFDQVRKLDLIDRVLRESLRLWPTAPAFALKPKGEYSLGQMQVTPRDALFVLVPMLHRDPSIWAEPERFDPDRFLPDAVAARPVHAWKPFGNGARACIGREFAMLEAKLVLGMLLHRFELHAGQSNYRLKIKETLTLKPAGLTLKVTRRADGASAVRPALVPATRASVPAAVTAIPALRSINGVAAHHTPLLVLFGSNTGTAEGIAVRIAADAEVMGYAVTLAAMDRYAGKLPQSGALLVVTASYNGLPPDNARAFCAALPNAAPGSLAGLQFAVFGCGSRDWAATYQAVPASIERGLLAAGAQRLLARGEGDTAGDYLGDLQAWYAPVWNVLAQAFSLSAAKASTKVAVSIERVQSAVEVAAETAGLALVEVLENRELVDMSSPFGRSKRHLLLKLPAGMHYRVGDHLEVLPEADPERVARVARRFALNLDEQVLLRGPKGHLPVDRPLSYRELLARHFELNVPASRRAVEAMLTDTRCPPEKQRLAALLADDETFRLQVTEKRRSLLDLMEEIAGCEMPLTRLLELLPPAKPRRYSISSAPAVEGEDRATLTVSVLDAPAWGGAGRYHGTCTSYLANVPVGARLVAAVRRPTRSFTPPEDINTPMVLVAAGSGIAPFRGFAQDRHARALAGESVGSIDVFFGCDHPDVDYLYREQWQAWEAAGIVRMHTAFFRQATQDEAGGDVSFVQHRLWQERARVIGLLDAGAALFVCGDGKLMAPAVREVLIEAYSALLPATRAAAEDWLARITAEGRYSVDAFG